MSKRGNGEGSIYRRKDGRWVGVVTGHDRQRKSFYGTSRHEVQLQLGAAVRARQQGRVLATPAVNVGNYLERWLEDTIRPSLRPMTYLAYRVGVRRLSPHLGRLRLSTLNAIAIQGAYSALLKRGLSRRSVEQTHTVLHRALRQAVLWGLIWGNPSDAVVVPRPAHRECEL
jgi:integrase